MLKEKMIIKHNDGSVYEATNFMELVTQLPDEWLADGFTWEIVTEIN